MKLLLPPLLISLTRAQDRYTPSNPNNILYEQSLDLGYESTSINITSDIPVTLQKYSDTSASFLMGAEPVPQNLGMLVITSDCSSDETNVVPNVQVDGDKITVRLDADSSAGYLAETTSYETVWSYVYGMCGFDYFDYFTTTEINIATDPGGEGDTETGGTIAPFAPDGSSSTSLPSQGSKPTLSSSDGTSAVQANVSASGTVPATVAALVTEAAVTTVSSGASATEENVATGPSETTSHADSTSSPPTSTSENVAGSPAPSASDNTAAGVDQEATDPSSGFTSKHSFHVRIILTLMVLLIATVFIPGQDATPNMFGYGKVFVAAAAASALFTKSVNIRQKEQASSSRFTRNLQDTCTYNVEILYDGCTRNVQLEAPSARVIDVVVQNYTSATNEDDQCQTDYSAILTFPASNATEVDFSNSSVVPAYQYSDWQCLRAIEGRPFVDGSGKGIMALPVVGDACSGQMNVEWAGVGVLVDAPDNSNATSYNHLKLGNEWTQRALGEHASIASFSAFSIALMTNAAPGWLVEDALKAGLDEIRHARVSFEIASTLLGKKVEPSSLPESKHQFGRDLAGLALAVAREGCVDETLSALGAAVEVDNIETLMKDGGTDSKYSGVEPDVMRWIGDELKTITLDESNHSALAWRALKWVCIVDSNACEVVKREVFDVSKLELRFQQRSEGDEVLASLMKAEWEKIYDAFTVSSSEFVCHNNNFVESNSDEPLVTVVTNRVLRAISC